MNFLIRRARTSDAEPISKLITRWAHHHLENPASQEAAAFLATLTVSATAGRIGAESFRYYVARDGAKLCGVIALREGFHVYHLFVDSDMHKQGVARALWEHAESQSSSSRFVVNSLIPAIPVYERFGFVVKGTPQSQNGLLFVLMERGQDT